MAQFQNAGILKFLIQCLALQELKCIFLEGFSWCGSKIYLFFYLLYFFKYLLYFLKNIFTSIGFLKVFKIISGEGSGTPLQHSCLEIPWMEEPGRLQSMRRYSSQMCTFEIRRILDYNDQEQIFLINLSNRPKRLLYYIQWDLDTHAVLSKAEDSDCHIQRGMISTKLKMYRIPGYYDVNEQWRERFGTMVRRCKLTNRDSWPGRHSQVSCFIHWFCILGKEWVLNPLKHWKKGVMTIWQ